MKKPRYNETKLRKLGARRIELLRQIEELDLELDPMIAAACAELVQQGQICSWTGYTSREKIRRIARAHGVEPLDPRQRAAAKAAAAAS